MPRGVLDLPALRPRTALLQRACRSEARRGQRRRANAATSEARKDGSIIATGNADTAIAAPA
jgi:hypothetical protein